MINKSQTCDKISIILQREWVYLSEKKGIAIVGDYIKHVIFFCLFVILMTIPDGVMEFFSPESLAKNDVKIAIIQSALSALIILFVYRRYKKQLKNYNPKQLGQSSFQWKDLAFVAFIFIISLLVGQIFDNLLQVDTAENQQLLEDLFTKLPIAMTISTVIIAPIIEELIFRGIFFNYFFNKNSLNFKILAIVSSGLVFGLVHEFALSINLLQYTILGVLMALIYAYTKNIRYNILFHVLNNALAVYTIFNLN